MTSRNRLKSAVYGAAILAACSAAGLAHAQYEYRKGIANLKVTPTPSPSSTGTGSATATPAPTPAPSPGVVELTTSSLSFGSLVLGSSLEKSLSVLNSGGQSIDLTSISVSAGGSDFTARHACGAQLGAGSSCDVTVKLMPTVRDARSGKLTVVSNVGTVEASLSGTGLSPAAASANPTSVSFASSLVGTQSTEVQAVVITNDGDVPLNISSVSVTQSSTAFSATGCVGTVQPVSSCTITVLFTPQAATNTGTLVVASDAATGGALSIPLSGGGTLPAQASVSPTSVTFAASGIGGQSAEIKTVTVSNTGNLPLTISSASVVTGATAFSASGCSGTTVQAGSSCDITVRFTPQAATNTGTLRISSNSATGATQDVTLSGSGNPSPLLTITTADPVFASSPIGYLSNETKTVTLKNTGTASLTVSSIAFSPATTVFSKSGNCTTLAVNASCTVSLSFTPSAVTNTATLRITSNAVNTPTRDVPVSGTGRVAGNMTITKAVYNANVTINSTGNLTTKLKAVCDGKSLCTFDPLTVLGTDPAPNVPKNMELTYTCSNTGSTVYSYSAPAEAGLRNHTITCP